MVDITNSQRFWCSHAQKIAIKTVSCVHNQQQEDGFSHIFQPPLFLFASVPLRFGQKMAQLIDGKAISKQVLDSVADELKRICEIESAFRPGLAIVQVGFGCNGC